MNKRLVILSNIILFSMFCLVIVNCNSKKNTKTKSGYIKEFDTLLEAESNKISSINRTFYRKLPSIHNELIEFKQLEGESYIIVVISEPNKLDFSIIVIEDFNGFLKDAKHIMNNKELDILIGVDSTKSTFMRKSISFEKGIFIRKEANKTPSIIFDLSEQSIKEIEEAYHLYLNE